MKKVLVLTLLTLTITTQFYAKDDLKKESLTEAQERASQLLYEETFAGTITPQRIEELIKQGARVDYCDGDVLSVLDQALLTGNKPAAEVLTKHHAQATEIGIAKAVELFMQSDSSERRKALEVVSAFVKSGRAANAEETKILKSNYFEAMQKCYREESLVPTEVREKHPAKALLIEKTLRQNACEAKSKTRMLLTAFNIFDTPAPQDAQG